MSSVANYFNSKASLAEMSEIVRFGSGNVELKLISATTYNHFLLSEPWCPSGQRNCFDPSELGLKTSWLEKLKISNSDARFRKKSKFNSQKSY